MLLVLAVHGAANPNSLAYAAGSLFGVFLFFWMIWKACAFKPVRVLLIVLLVLGLGSMLVITVLGPTPRRSSTTFGAQR
jgi:hypothetical protein